MTDFKVGDAAVIQFINYGDHTFRDAKVTKVLKTRIVVEYTRNGATETKRFVRPTYGNRLVNEGHAGTPGGSRQYQLLLEANAETAERRQAVAEQTRKNIIENQALSAVASTIKGGHISTADAEETIAALQALIASRA